MSQRKPARGGGAGDPATLAVPSAPANIIVLASQPDVDECDVVCDALPAFTCNDLSGVETSWVEDHIAHCGFCAREKYRYQRLCSCLDAVYADDQPTACPPPRFLTAKPAAWFSLLSSPIGPLFVATTDRALIEIAFGAGRTEAELQRQLRERGFDPVPRPESPAEPDDVFTQVEAQLAEYFAGERTEFDLPLDLAGLPLFTREVLAATSDVPFGGLDTYRGIATRIGQPTATRAVGNALNRNPLPVVVPCHRIIRSDGSAGGYGGGLDIKFRLLKHEGVMLPAMSG